MKNKSLIWIKIIFRNSSTSISSHRDTLKSTLEKVKTDDFEENRLAVFLETYESSKKVIGHVPLERSENLEDEIKEVFQEVKH